MRLSVRCPRPACAASGRPRPRARRRGAGCPPGGCCEGRALGQPRGGRAGATSGRAGRGRGRYARVASAAGRRAVAGSPVGAYEAVAARLGPGHPRRAAEACSPSVVGGLAATPIKIRTGGRSRGARARRSTRPPPHPTWPWASRVWVAGCSAISFPGAPIRQVSCNTLLGGFRLLWPPSCCRDRRTPFGLCARVAHRNAA